MIYVVDLITIYMSLIREMQNVQTEKKDATMT